MAAQRLPVWRQSHLTRWTGKILATICANDGVGITAAIQKNQTATCRFLALVNRGKDGSSKMPGSLHYPMSDRRRCDAVHQLSAAVTVSYTHLRAHETRHDLVCRLLLEKKKIKTQIITQG